MQVELSNSKAVSLVFRIPFVSTFKHFTNDKVVMVDLSGLWKFYPRNHWCLAVPRNLAFRHHLRFRLLLARGFVRTYSVRLVPLALTVTDWGNVVVASPLPGRKVSTRGWFPAPLLVVTSLGGFASLSSIAGIAVVLCLFS